MRRSTDNRLVTHVSVGRVRSRTGGLPMWPRGSRAPCSPWSFFVARLLIPLRLRVRLDVAPRMAGQRPVPLATTCTYRRAPFSFTKEGGRMFMIMSIVHRVAGGTLVTSGLVSVDVIRAGELRQVNND